MLKRSVPYRMTFEDSNWYRYRNSSTAIYYHLTKTYIDSGHAYPRRLSHIAASKGSPDGTVLRSGSQAVSGVLLPALV